VHESEICPFECAQPAGSTRGLPRGADTTWCESYTLATPASLKPGDCTLAFKLRSAEAARDVGLPLGAARLGADGSHLAGRVRVTKEQAAPGGHRGLESDMMRRMHEIIQRGLLAARRNLRPGLALQAVALALVLLYYFHVPTREVLLRVAEFKRQAGAALPPLATALFGGLIPFLLMAARGEIPAGRHRTDLFFLLGFWAVNGVIIDFLYRAQAAAFGDQVDFPTVLKKTLVDQFVFCPLWSAPFAAVAMHWKNCGFSLRVLRAGLTLRAFALETMAVLLGIWAVWLPAVAIVYSLPLALQFPLFNVVLCFWSLLLAALSGGANHCSKYVYPRRPVS
jgi:hypothetical protein